MTTPTRPPVLFDIPAGTPARRCRSCNAEVYWIQTATGKKMPVDAAVDGGVAPGLHPGQGVSHFATCPHADQHRRPR